MFEFHDVMSVSKINPCCLQRMNTRRTIGQMREVAAVGNNQVPPQAPAEELGMLVKLG